MRRIRTIAGLSIPGLGALLIAGCADPNTDTQSDTKQTKDADPGMSFFLTSAGPGDGANLGGLAGADAHCNALASIAGSKDKVWRAYLSTTGIDGVNAKDRIGTGPWYNANGEQAASSVENLLSDSNNMSKTVSISESGTIISGRGNKPNRHDILTGTMLDGTASGEAGDTTCANWTSNGEGHAFVGHHDRTGGGANPTSWSTAHKSRGCSQENLRSSGGDGLFYCFAVK